MDQSSHHYGNFEATLSTPQYGFEKGLKEFKELGYVATIKELDKNLIVKNVIDMLLARSITHDMMKMSLAYLMFLKKEKDVERSKPGDVQTVDLR